MITSAYLVYKGNKIKLRTMMGTKSKDRTLILQWFAKPSTPEEKAINIHSKVLAKRKLTDIKKQKFETGEGYDLEQRVNRSFLDFYDMIIRERESFSITHYRHAVCSKQKFENYLDELGYQGITCKMLDNQISKDYKNYLMFRAGLSRHSASKYWATFKKAVGSAMANRSIMYNPVIDIKGIPYKKFTKHKEALTKMEVEKLLKTSTEGIFKSPDSPNYIPMKEFFSTCMFIGIGVAEAQRLKWSDINVNMIDGVEKWSFNYTRVKTGTYYDNIPLSNEAVKRLKLCKKLFRGQYVFPNCKIQKNNRQYEKLREWVKRAGIDKHITPHCVRSTFISMYINNVDNADLDLMAKYVGHTDSEVTKGYLTYEDKKKRQLAESMPEIDEHRPNLQAV